MGLDIDDVTFEVSTSDPKGTHGSIEANAAGGWPQIDQIEADTLGDWARKKWGSVYFNYWTTPSTKSVDAIVQGTTDYHRRPSNWDGILAEELRFSAFVKGQVKVKGCCPSKKYIVDYTVDVEGTPISDIKLIGGNVHTEPQVNKKSDAGWFELDASNCEASFWLEAVETWVHDRTAPEKHEGVSQVNASVSCKP